MTLAMYQWLKRGKLRSGGSGLMKGREDGNAKPNRSAYVPHHLQSDFAKSIQLVEAGWKYTPTADSDDMATCTYCSLALDGWEPKDNPL